MDDAALVRAACDGDKRAFADIYDRYSDRLYSFLCAVVRNRDDAADLLQDTFLTAGSRLHQLRDPSKLRPWLYAIARHLAMKELGRSRRQDPLDDLEVTDTAAGPDEVAAQTELAELIGAAAEGLGTQDRVVLDLHLRQGLEGQELGAALGVSPSHAYVMIKRMRDQVERSLGALLVARQGSRDCGELKALLGSWDGRFTALWRKRVARHVDGCDACNELRRRVLSPISMMGAVPLVPAPAEARQVVLEQLQLVSHTARPWPASSGGFPPPMVRRRTGLRTLAGVAAVLLGLLAGPTVAGPDALTANAAKQGVDALGNRQLVFPFNGDPQLVFPFNGDPQLIFPFNGDGQPGPEPAVAAPPAPPAARPSPPSPAASPSPAPTSPADPGPTPAGSREPAPEEPDPTPERERSDAAAPDTDGPSLGAVRIQPRTIRANHRHCGPGSTTSSVLVEASDPSGIASVVLRYQGAISGSIRMSPSGAGAYAATIGPLAPVLREGESISLALQITATDNAGNITTRMAGTLEVSCPPSSSSSSAEGEQQPPRT